MRKEAAQMNRGTTTAARVGDKEVGTDRQDWRWELSLVVGCLLAELN